MDMSGAGVFVHLYLGTYDADGGVLPLTEIQDVVFGENRDRKYSKDVYELRGVYTVQDSDFDMKQFGIFFTNDTIYIEFHFNTMIQLVGRKLIPGDVLELPNLRDDTLLNEGKAINKFYVVEDGTFATDGYGTTWLHHIWRVKVSPMTNSQEYADILDLANLDPFGLETGGTLGDIIGVLANDLNINEQVIDEAMLHVAKRKLDTRQFYIVPGEETTSQNPWVFTGDGIPPNGAFLVGSGNNYPDSPVEGDYYLRTDYSPHTLFRRQGSIWRMQELDYRRGGWNAMHRLLEDFVENTNTTRLPDGSTLAEKIALSKAVKPLDDF